MKGLGYYASNPAIMTMERLEYEEARRKIYEGD